MKPLLCMQIIISVKLLNFQFDKIKCFLLDIESMRKVLSFN